MSDKGLYPTLLSTGHVGKLTLRNRMVMPPMTTDYGSVDGYVTQRMIDYYAARARGGVGMMVVEMACVDSPAGKGEFAELGIDDDKFIPGLSELAGAIKEQGARAFQQIHHAGRRAVSWYTKKQAVAPSAKPARHPRAEVPRALTVSEIEDFVHRFATAAQRVQRAGFDGVELHGAHGYLLSEFLSPLANERSDEYGGSLENRARFLLDVVKEIRRRLGSEFPISVRLSGDEFVPGGITIAETRRVAQMLQELGVSVLHISAGSDNTPRPVGIAPQSFPNGHLIPLAAAVKEVVNVPVIGVCRIKEADLAEQVLVEGRCDLVSTGRALIADPEFPNKVAEGRRSEIRPCISCHMCVHTTLVEEREMVCTVNAAAGREREFSLAPAEVKKKVVVVGGGPSGLEAARVAASRGHEVHLYEHEGKLGGQLRLAAVPPHKAELGLFADYLSGSLDRLGVSVHVGSSVDADFVQALSPDAVVVATGAEPIMPPIPRTDGPQVTLAHDVLAGRSTAGGRVVIIGGGMVGCETAEYFAAQGTNQVTMVEMLEAVATDMIPALRGLLLDRLTAAGVQLLTETRADAIGGEGLTVIGKDGQRRDLPANSIVLAVGARASDALRAALEKKVPELHVIGDAVKPRRILEAVHDGAAAGLAI